MNSLIERFIEVARIPKCSFKAQKMFEYLVTYAKNEGFDVESDKAGNIRAYKEPSKLCLQAHYDIVCIGDAENIEVVEKDGYLMAKNSSLGADNCVAVVYMLEFMKKYKNIEYLFTANEEVGLLGAKEIELKLASKYLLNMDSEKEGDISIGCAGGYEIVAFFELFFEEIKESGYFYEIGSRGFKGGHSGIDIDKGIKNAIKELAFLLKKLDVRVCSISGGERLNSIPVESRAVVYSKNRLNLDSEFFDLKEIQKVDRCIKNDKELLTLLCAIHSGVLDFDRVYDVVSSSINLSKIEQSKDMIKLELMGRANSNELLEKNITQMVSFFEIAGCKNISINEKYPAWIPQESEFARIVKSVFDKYFKSQYVVYHAGFECGVLISKFPWMEAVSIGPNIYNPHSKSERVEIASFLKVFDAIEELINLIGS